MNLKNFKCDIKGLRFNMGWFPFWLDAFLGARLQLIFSRGREKMDFPHVLIPKESPAATPINLLSMDFAILNMIVKNQYNSITFP